MNNQSHTPPHDLELEQAIIGTFLIEGNAILENRLNPDWFYKPENIMIAKAICNLGKQGTPPDLLQATIQLKKEGNLENVGGPLYLSESARKVASAANLKHHLKNLQELFLRRQLATFAQKQYYKSFDPTIDLDDLLIEYQNNILNVLDFNEAEIVSLDQSFEKVIEQAKRNREGGNITGIGTGLFKLDNFTNGMQKGDLIIIAGETSAGKTSLGISILKNAVFNFGARAAVYSLEMTNSQLSSRLFSQETGISAKRILSGYMTPQEIETLEIAKEKRKGALMFYDERSNNNIDTICASIRRLHLKYKINLVMVDYLQIISGDERKADETKIAEIARKLKNIARELEITVIALSQLRRSPDRPKPNIARLRGSGQLEEAADIVLLLYRPEMYNIKYDDPFTAIPNTGTAQVIIGKGRNIGTGSFILRFNPETSGFTNYIHATVDPDEHLEPKSKTPY
ncbi:replicative DNA helicase [Bacteroidales bacterium 6E]|nr:replicative DNA helicase [Bacteroidales bacterium 6E]